MTHILRLWLALVLLCAAPIELPASEGCRGQRGCGGHGRHGAGGRGCCGAGDTSSPGARGDARSDQELFHWLVERRDSIRRTVENTADGVVTLTESDDAEVAAGLREHVAAMHARLLEERPIHRRDPLFRAIFENAHRIEMRIEATERGVRVEERSDDPWVAKLIQAHAEVVSGFLKNGRAEMRRDHALPPRP